MKQNGRILMLIAALFGGAAVNISGQTPPQQQSMPPEQQQGNSGGDPIRQLNLTPEQREQIRGIREGNKVERAEINQRVREANRALEEALDSDNPDEAVVEQRMRDLGTAQTAAMRMRILTEVKIRKVLTREQLVVLRNLRVNARQLERQRLQDERRQRRQILNGTPAFQNERNQTERQMRRRQLQRQRP